jgi:hypothetical protein
MTAFFVGLLNAPKTFGRFGYVVCPLSAFAHVRSSIAGCLPENVGG